MKKLSSWKEDAPESFYVCCTAQLRETNETSDMFTNSWAKCLSPLVWRVPIFIWSIIIITLSVTFFWGPREKFLLYMTHWGLVLIFLESLFGIVVCVKSQTQSKDGGLAWHVRLYWVLYNIAVPVAFLITLFYWAVLRLPGKKMNFAPNPILDVMLHGVNSGLMLLELVLSKAPSRLLHVMQPLYFAGIYLLFSVTYYLCGGLDPWGNEFIYPVIDWSKPVAALVVVTLTALFLGLMHILTVLVAALRDYLLKKYLGDKLGKYNDGFDA
ncbi:protein rolling stone-like [Aricia agestis]|uniref:protein rolling stone-like n=1 Tax=Aricia agestis TaxID=91739 RepID=UPI001C2024DC|nr:protein rolling stone-like [Aricia agestis]XP_041974867.1 protein rolling stone-like [Aricia agestis]